jgi:hypothetical protein
VWYLSLLTREAMSLKSSRNQQKTQLQSRIWEISENSQDDLYIFFLLPPPLLLFLSSPLLLSSSPPLLLSSYPPIRSLLPPPSLPSLATTNPAYPRNKFGTRGHFRHVLRSFCSSSPPSLSLLLPPPPHCCRFSPATLDELVVRLTPSGGKANLEFVDTFVMCSGVFAPPSLLIDKLIERGRPPSGFTEEQVGGGRGGEREKERKGEGWKREGERCGDERGRRREKEWEGERWRENKKERDKR